MKRVLTLLFAICTVGSMQAQLKEVKFGEKSSSNQTVINVPDFKKGGQAITSPNQFVPKTLSFYQSEKNGLKVESRSKESQLPIFISGNPTLNLRSVDTPEGMGYNFLENAKELMSIKNPSEEFKKVMMEIDELGMTHVKYQQTYKGVPIYGAEVIFHSNEREQFLNGRYVKTPTLESVSPSLTSQSAESNTISDLGEIVKIENDKFGLFDFESIVSELVIYNDQLAYKVEAYKTIIDRWEYIIDAYSGEVVSKHQNMCKFHNHSEGTVCTHNHESDNKAVVSAMPPPDGPVTVNAQDLFGTTRSINAYEVGGKFYMIDANRVMYDGVSSNIPDDPVGVIWTIDAFNTNPANSNFQYDHVSSNNSNFSGKNIGVSAQYNGGQAYQYFKNVHERESINNQGGNIIGLINISDEDGSSLGNAFWNGIAMFYGNGDNSFNELARGLDVAGHEMSHGVVQSTANLQYQGESGALNESFADIFGAMIDRDDWKIGEDVVKSSAFPSGALRSMDDPHNGASTGNFNAGWQPRVYSERFTGSQDNGGVHINSGIPNWSFFKFATTSGVGKNRAEKVYYRALEKYLTKSSQFIDARLAVVQAAKDLYGDDVANAAKTAWDQVEVFNGNGTTTQTDVETNPGADLILFTTEDQNNLYISNADGNLVFNPLTEENPISVPSVTDDGSEILFVNQDKELYYINIDWSSNTIVAQGAFESTDQWRNAVFSKDGLRMAALRDGQENKVFVYDFVTETGIDYELYNPTFTDGVSTGDVLYADALEFDFSGRYLMYDAFNRILSATGTPIDYWDIGFIEVFNTGAGTFINEPKVEKLFGQLPDGVSIGNPTFSKNSDYIIAFDFLQDNAFKILGSNIETNETGTIFDNNSVPGYPNFSNTDDKVVFDVNDSNGKAVLGGAVLESNKIQSNNASVQLSFNDTGIKWGVWFGNGERELTDTEDLLPIGDVSIFPNPVTDKLTISSSIEDAGQSTIKVTDILGRTVYSAIIEKLDEIEQIDVADLASGQYILTINTEKGALSQMFVKQ